VSGTVHVVHADSPSPALFGPLEHVADTGDLLETADVSPLRGLGPVDAAELLEVAHGDRLDPPPSTR
jgi:hypothetical protein